MKVCHSVLCLGVVGECPEIRATSEDSSLKNSQTLLSDNSWDREWICIRLFQCLRLFPTHSSQVSIYLLADSLCTMLSRTVRNQSDLFSFGSWRMVLTWGPIEPRPGCVCCSLLFLHWGNKVAIFRAVVPNLCGTRDWSCGRQFFHGPESEGWFWDHSSKIHRALFFFPLLLLHQVHLRSSGID